MSERSITGGGYINSLNNGFPLGSCSVVYPRGYEMHACRSMQQWDRAGKESSLAAINNRWNALASRNRVTMHKFAPTKRWAGETSSGRPLSFPLLVISPTLILMDKERVDFLNSSRRRGVEGWCVKTKKELLDELFLCWIVLRFLF